MCYKREEIIFSGMKWTTVGIGGISPSLSGVDDNWPGSINVSRFLWK